MSNQQIEERQEEEKSKELAEILGISYDEVCELTWDIDTNESSDGLIYEYLIIFSDDSPNEILQKIGGLENGNTVRVSPETFDNHEEDDWFE